MSRIATIVVFLALLAALVVKIRTSDGFHWIAILGFPLILTVFAIFNRYLFLAVIGAVFYIYTFFMWMPSTFKNMTGNDTAQDAGILLLCAVWLTVLSMFRFRELEARHQHKTT